MYVPLLVNELYKNILLIVQYKYLKSCSEHVAAGIRLRPDHHAMDHE